MENSRPDDTRSTRDEMNRDDDDDSGSEDGDQ